MAPPSAPPPSLFPSSTVQHVASTSLSLPPLRENVATSLASDTEHRLRLILQDAEKFMRHSRRSRLTCEDVKRALEVKGMEPIYGFLPPPYTNSSTAQGKMKQPQFKKVMTSSGVVYQVEEEEIDLEQVAKLISSRNSSASTRRKGGVGWKAHWLAIEGVQPLIPENPTPAEMSSVDESERGAGAVEPTFAGANTSGAIATASAVSAASAAPSGSSDTINATTQPLVKHILSRELQVYYRRLTEAILHGINSLKNGSATDAQLDVPMADDIPDEQQQEDPTSLAALASLSSDPGLHQLVPYLAQWISTNITAALSLSSTPGPSSSKRSLVVGRMVSSIEAMLANPYLGIEGYIHLFLPPLLSTILISLPSSEYPTSTRRKSSELLASLLGKYSGSYPSLKPRVTRILLEAAFRGTAAPLSAAGPAADGVDGGQQPDAVGTKLGAILALKACKGGMARAIVRARSASSNRSDGAEEGAAEAEEPMAPWGSKLRSLGEWLDIRRKEGKVAKREADEVVAAVKVSPRS